EADQGDLEVAGGAQQVHHAHHVTVGHALVGAQEQALLPVHLGGGVEGGGETGRRNGIVAQRQRAVSLDGDEHRPVGARLGLGGGDRQVHRDIHRRERRRHHEDDEQNQHHVDERRDVDLVALGELVVIVLQSAG